jgi:hypothetical protein
LEFTTDLEADILDLWLGPRSNNKQMAVFGAVPSELPDCTRRQAKLD